MKEKLLAKMKAEKLAEVQQEEKAAKERFHRLMKYNITTELLHLDGMMEELKITTTMSKQKMDKNLNWLPQSKTSKNWAREIKRPKNES